MQTLRKHDSGEADNNIRPMFPVSSIENRQVLVLDDMIGLSNFRPRFVKKYSNIRTIIEKSVKNYCEDVKQKKFPSSQHVYKF